MEYEVDVRRRYKTLLLKIQKEWERLKMGCKERKRVLQVSKVCEIGLKGKRKRLKQVAEK